MSQANEYKMQASSFRNLKKLILVLVSFGMVCLFAAIEASAQNSNQSFETDIKEVTNDDFDDDDIDTELANSMDAKTIALPWADQKDRLHIFSDLLAQNLVVTTGNDLTQE